MRGGEHGLTDRVEQLAAMLGPQNGVVALDAEHLLDRLSPGELGRLLGLFASFPGTLSTTGELIGQRHRLYEPTVEYGSAAAVEIIDGLIDRPERFWTAAKRSGDGSVLESTPERDVEILGSFARLVVDRLVDPIDQEVAAAIRRLSTRWIDDAPTNSTWLGLTSFGVREHFEKRLRDWEGEFPNRTAALAEWVVLPDLDPLARLQLLQLRDGWRRDSTVGYEALVRSALYSDMAETQWFAALSRIRAVHSGDLPYKSDKAFFREDGEAIGRILGFVFGTRPSWMIQADLDDFAVKVSTAPDPSANSAPSQSTAYSLMLAVEASPTPIGLRALSAMRGSVRHASLKKRAVRKERIALRKLSERSDLFSILEPGEPIDKKMARALCKSIEYLYLLPPMSLAEFDQRVTAHPQVRKTAEQLVWVVRDGRSEQTARLTKKSWVSASGEDLRFPSEGTVDLWHPLGSNEVEEWRAHIIERRIKQPFSQVFREFYRVPDELATGSLLNEFGDVEVGILSVCGVALSVGWPLGRKGAPNRRFGDFTVALVWDTHAYPGAEGTARTRGVEVGHVDGSEARWGDLEPIVQSEILRQVDLMVSAGAFAIGAEDTLSGSKSAASRSAALQGMLDSSGVAVVDGRYVVVNGHAIHIGTGRVSKDGAPIEVDTAGTRVSWLPYPDPVLSRIVRAIAILNPI